MGRPSKKDQFIEQVMGLYVSREALLELLGLGIPGVGVPA